MCPQSVLSKKQSPKTFKKRATFLKSYKGSKVKKSFFTLFFIKNEIGESRVGVTIPKSSGTAVVRNRWKRWVKEEFRKTETKGSSLDFHFFIKSAKTKEEYKKVEFSLARKEISDALQSGLRKSK